MTIIDGLTQAYNKRYFVENLEKEIPRCTRHQRPLSLLMMDIDHFKKINDEHGHLTGDYVLREMARRVRSRVRKEEVFARYGGEEFALTLPETSREQATKVAEDLRRLVCAEPFDFEGDRIPVTVSLGVGTTVNEIACEAFIKMADENLYKAKRSGRNRVIS
jgi:diguanylate cyclase (GGDEF)-like protein